MSIRHEYDAANGGVVEIRLTPKAREVVVYFKTAASRFPLIVRFGRCDCFVGGGAVREGNHHRPGVFFREAAAIGMAGADPTPLLDWVVRTFPDVAHVVTRFRPVSAVPRRT